MRPADSGMGHGQHFHTPADHRDDRRSRRSGADLVPSRLLMSQTDRERPSGMTVKLRAIAACWDSHVGLRELRERRNDDMDSLIFALSVT